jgi:hypothetical protein
VGFIKKIDPLHNVWVLSDFHVIILKITSYA